MVWTRTLVDGAVLSVLASALIFASLRMSPRIWLSDFPADIRAAVPPKDAAERRLSLFWGVPLLALLAGAPLASNVLLSRQHPELPSFGTLFLNAFGVAFIFNLVDLLIIDWLVICAWTPRSLVIPGTEGLAGYKDYWHHFRGFLVGTAFSAVIGAAAAAATSWTLAG